MKTENTDTQTHPSEIVKSERIISLRKKLKSLWKCCRLKIIEKKSRKTEGKITGKKEEKN